MKPIMQAAALAFVLAFAGMWSSEGLAQAAPPQTEAERAAAWAERAAADFQRIEQYGAEALREWRSAARAQVVAETEGNEEAYWVALRKQRFYNDVAGSVIVMAVERARRYAELCAQAAQVGDLDGARSWARKVESIRRRNEISQ